MAKINTKRTRFSAGVRQQLAEGVFALQVQREDYAWAPAHYRVGVRNRAAERRAALARKAARAAARCFEAM